MHEPHDLRRICPNELRASACYRIASNKGRRMQLEQVTHNASFGGAQRVYRHASRVLDCEMKVAVYLPARALAGERCAVVYWLSGLTCSEQNFITKAGAQAHASSHGLIVVVPDTSPRGKDVPDAEGSDLGQGAGFYVNATQTPWHKHYRMYEYVVNELPALIDAAFTTLPDRTSIMGHSMGGHGALICALKNPGRYRSVSAFAPIVAPSEVAWGKRAFAAYLGEERQAWLAYDACALIPGATERLPLLIDQGDADPFLCEQLQPERLEAACRSANHPLQLRMRAGYDHSYYFIATFLAEHFAHHAAALKR
jgi:S-formylglutathione hydrolase